MSERVKSRTLKRGAVIETPPEELKILEAVAEAVEEVDEGFTMKRSPWVMRIKGLNADIPLTGIKLPIFTTGMVDRGDLTIETINVPDLRLNSYFRSWLMKPTPRTIEIKVLHVDGAPIEKWTAEAIPGLMGFGELDTQDDAPWATQVAFSVTSVKIEPCTD